MATVQKQQGATPSSEKRIQSIHPPQTGAPSPATDKIAARAYEIWRARGCPHGHDTEHWLQAERELRGAKSGPH